MTPKQAYKLITATYKVVFAVEKAQDVGCDKEAREFAVKRGRSIRVIEGLDCKMHEGGGSFQNGRP